LHRISKFLVPDENFAKSCKIHLSNSSAFSFDFAKLSSGKSRNFSIFNAKAGLFVSFVKIVCQVLNNMIILIGVGIFSDDSTLQLNASHQIKDQISVTSAELFAIFIAIKHLGNSEVEKAAILIDSTSARFILKKHPGRKRRKQNSSTFLTPAIKKL
jgi:hypothetical protein